MSRLLAKTAVRAGGMLPYAALVLAVAWVAMLFAGALVGGDGNAYRGHVVFTAAVWVLLNVKERWVARHPVVERTARPAASPPASEETAGMNRACTPTHGEH